MNILYITHEQYKLGGSSLSLLNLIKGIRNSFNPIIIAPCESVVSEFFRSNGIETHIVPFELSFTDKKGLRRCLTCVPRFVRDWVTNRRAVSLIGSKFADRRIMIVHSNSSAVGIGAAVAQRLQCCHIWHLREFLNHGLGFEPTVGWPLFRWLIRRSDRIICITNAIKEHYHLNDRTNVSIIHDAVRERMPPLRLDTKDNYILFAGGTNPAKGVEVAIRGFRDISKSNPHLILKIIGHLNQEHMPKLNALVSSLGISGKVKFIGFCDNVEALYRHAQCMLMCSPNEGMGRVTIEAMFYGCPVIGFARAGTKELISHENNGLLYEDVQEIPALYQWLQKDRSRRDALIYNAFEFAQQNFTEEVYAEQIKSIYASITNAKPEVT